MMYLIDPFWLAKDLQLTSWQFFAIPIGTSLLLFALSKMSYVPNTGGYQRASLTNKLLRFGVGLIGGAAIIAFGLVLSREALEVALAFK